MLTRANNGDELAVLNHAGLRDPRALVTDSALNLRRVACLGDALRDATLAFQSNVALIESDRHRESIRYSYAEARREAERVGAYLQGQGVGVGERVAVAMSNQSCWVLGGMGALWAGQTLVPLDYKLTAKEIAILFRHAKPRALLTEYPIWRDLVSVDREAFSAALVLVSEAPSAADLAGAVRWEDLPAASMTVVSRTREDDACIVYSSGTSGTPKGCVLTHDNYLQQAEALGNLFPMRESDRYFSVLPTNHAIDFMGGMIVRFLFGAAVVHQRALRPEFLGPTMKRYEITHTALVPRLLETLKERIEDKLTALPEWKRMLVDGLIGANNLATARAPNHALSKLLLGPIHAELGGSLRLIFAGGAFVERSTAEFFYKLGLPVVIGYGLTEACTVITLNDLSPFRGDSVGKPVPGVEVELRDKNAQGVGEVYVRGRTLMRGYLEAPELTDAALVDGWLRTGDLGVIDVTGHLKLLGRAKNMIVTAGGKNVYPEDVEQALGALPCEELCVFAESFVWPSGKLTDERLIVVLRVDANAESDATPASHAALGRALTERNRTLPEHKRISAYVVWNHEFPKTASLKVKREVLARELAAAGGRELLHDLGATS
jgi:long-chain acyl-CoA synthetase